MGSHYCDGKLGATVNRSYLYTTAWDTRHRTAQPAPGANTQHNNGSQTYTYDSAFYDTCSSWAWNLDYAARTFGKVGITDGIDWIGSVGVKACHRSTWAHNRARGFDLTKIVFDPSDYYMDSNSGWGSSSQLTRRRYVAVAASLRRYFRQVLTGWYNSDHRDHIHFDNRYPVDALNSGRKSDTTLVQAACVNLNGESIAIDGAWGSNTTAAYNRLLTVWNMNCSGFNPRTNASHAKTFLWYVMACGLKNVDADYYRSTYC